MTLSKPDRYPRSSRYDADWIVSLDMGPHPLWQLEDLLSTMKLEPGAKVLDLGCGGGATSVYLARELGARVTAVDLWVSQDQLRDTMRAAGVERTVAVLNGDARRLPFPDAEFDAVISIDAFEYFGTDVHFLPSLLRVIRAGGQVGIATPALRVDPYEVEPPAYITDVVGWQAAAWHSPAWWKTHWELSGMVEAVTARLQHGGRQDWLDWCAAVGEPRDGPVPTMLATDVDELIGFALLHATKK